MRLSIGVFAKTLPVIGETISIDYLGECIVVENDK
jgi:hypothetical protein